jgi:hypothetical protein
LWSSSKFWLCLISEVSSEGTYRASTPLTPDQILEQPLQDTSVFKPNQDCEEKLTCDDHKSNSEVINLPHESLMKMSLYLLYFLRFKINIHNNNKNGGFTRFINKKKHY